MLDATLCNATLCPRPSCHLKSPVCTKLMLPPCKSSNTTITEPGQCPASTSVAVRLALVNGSITWKGWSTSRSYTTSGSTPMTPTSKHAVIWLQYKGPWAQPFLRPTMWSVWKWVRKYSVLKCEIKGALKKSMYTPVPLRGPLSITIVDPRNL